MIQSFTSAFSPSALQELAVIMAAINSFSFSTCIRFIPRIFQPDYVYIQALKG